jgi:predicted DNA-binding transcriptional regulator AlpA
MPCDIHTLLLGARQAAPLCGVSVPTWWRLNSAGKTPAAVKLGHRTLWRADELRAWVEAGCPSREEWEAHGNG